MLDICCMTEGCWRRSSVRTAVERTRPHDRSNTDSSTSMHPRRLIIHPCALQLSRPLFPNRTVRRREDMWQTTIGTRRMEELWTPFRALVQYGTISELVDERIFPLVVGVAHLENFFGLEKIPEGRKRSALRVSS